MAKNRNEAKKGIGFNDDRNKIPVPSGKSWFLGIGIDKYSHFTPLNNAVKDVNDIRNLLIEKYDFEISNTELLCNEDATRSNIIEKLSEYDQLPPEDRLLIYYSGHGHVIGSGKTQKGFWIPVDAANGKIAGYINNVEIRDWIKDYLVRHLLLISDSCFSQSLITRSANKSISGTFARWDSRRSRFVFSSGKGIVSDGEPGENSPFAAEIIRSLQEQDKIINIVALADEVTKAVSWNYEQDAECSPLHLAGHDGGQFLFFPKAVVSPEEQDWKIACEENTIEHYHVFIEKHTQSQYFDAAMAALILLEEEDIWNKAKAKHIPSAYFKYIREYPKGKYVIEAAEAIQSLKNKATAEKTPATSMKTYEIIIPQPTPVMDLNKNRLPFEPEMVLVKGGSFLMGSNLTDIEKPIHDVTLSNFSLGKYPVTQAQWKAVMGYNPSYFKVDERQELIDIILNDFYIDIPSIFKGDEWPKLNFYIPDDFNRYKSSNFNGDESPVEMVSWYDTQEFIKKLNKKTGKKYRLPTEAEWEYAAREGGKQILFGNGKNIIDPKEINFDGRAEYKKDYSIEGEYRAKTVPVGSLNSPNSLGLHDMSGNVWEWCEDKFDSGYYIKSPKKDPTGPVSGSSCVVRGGSWLNVPQYCRVAWRHCYAPENRYSLIGFRLARTD